MDLKAKFNQSSINESIKKEIKMLDDYAAEHNFDYNRVRKTVEFGDKERIKATEEARMKAGSIDIASLVKGTDLGKEYEEEKIRDFEREQEKFKSNQEGYKVDRKIQEEWVEKSKLMQEKSKVNVGEQKIVKKRGRPKKVKN